VIKPNKLNGNFSDLELLRERLSRNEKTLHIEEMGAGSKNSVSNTRTVKSISNGGLTSPKYSALLYRLIKHFHMREIIELGTSLGVNTLYLAKYEATKVTTFEGSPEIANFAQSIFDQQHADNIKIIEGNIDRTLSSFLDGSIRPDLVYLDANHRHEATMRYFNTILHNKHDETIVVIDDIKWSKSMQKAWKEIILHPEVTMSIDLNKFGIVFFKPDFTKQHYVLAF
jgi:predicted O-methyltransferase YrrM